MTKNRIKVLIVEDDQEDYLLAKHYLRDIRTKDYIVDWESNYSKALLRIAEQVHDVYLIDYNLGNNTGIDLVEQATNSGIMKPFIFLTGMDKHAIDQRALEVGAVDFLVKSKINKELLDRSIRYAIRQKQIENQLLDSNNTKNKLFSIISHDLRGPLTTLVTSLEIIADLDESYDDDTKERILSEMNTTTKTTLDLLDNLLSWARSQIGALAPDLEIMDLQSLVGEIMQLLEGNRKQKNIQLISDIEKGTEIFADRNFINLVLRNLCSNAIKFTAESGIVKITAEKSFRSVRIMVQDTGVGMDEEAIQQVMLKDKFYSTYGTDNEKGSGLGLLISREFIEKHGSELEIDSTPGKGSKFTFSLKSQADNN